MNTLLSIFCIVFFSIFTYSIIKGANLQKTHKYDCRVIYIPEDIDLETAFESVRYKTIDQLKKRAKELGASNDFVNQKSMDDNKFKLKLKVFIIQNSIGDEHILFKEIDNRLANDEADELVEKREYCRSLIRSPPTPGDPPIVPSPNCPELPLPTQLQDYVNVNLPKPNTTLDTTLDTQHMLLQDPYVYIEELRKDMDEDF